jgi:hypothetical protein
VHAAGAGVGVVKCHQARTLGATRQCHMCISSNPAGPQQLAILQRIKRNLLAVLCCVQGPDGACGSHVLTCQGGALHPRGTAQQEQQVGSTGILFGAGISTCCDSQRGWWCTLWRCKRRWPYCKEAHAVTSKMDQA